MKGIVFTVLQKMVEEKMGLAAWDKIVSEEPLESGGIYTAAATYPTEEVLTIVRALSKMTGATQDQLVRAFGKFMLHNLALKYAVFFEKKGLFPFLMSVDQVIHKEVKKLYVDAELPEFDCELREPDTLVMTYRSKRKLCALAEGLIEGAAEHFGEKISITHLECMRSGASCCRIDIRAQAPELRKVK